MTQTQRKHLMFMTQLENSKHAQEEQLERELDTQKDYQYASQFASKYSDYGYRC